MRFRNQRVPETRLAQVDNAVTQALPAADDTELVWQVADARAEELANLRAACRDLRGLLDRSEVANTSLTAENTRLRLALRARAEELAEVDRALVALRDGQRRAAGKTGEDES